MSATHYVLGTHDEEIARLGFTTQRVAIAHPCRLANRRGVTELDERGVLRGEDVEVLSDCAKIANSRVNPQTKILPVPPFKLIHDLGSWRRKGDRRLLT